MEKKVYLVQIGDLDGKILQYLQKHLNRFFKNFIVSVDILPKMFPLDETDYILERQQYYGKSILRKLEYYVKSNKLFCTLGILDKDIFSISKNKKPYHFVFGLARTRKDLDSPGVSIVSITRLREQFYNRRTKKKREQKRILKEAIHEIGHTLGLHHCDNDCVMQFSSSVYYVDKKPSKFCKACQKELNIFFNVIKSSKFETVYLIKLKNYINKKLN